MVPLCVPVEGEVNCSLLCGLVGWQSALLARLATQSLGGAGCPARQMDKHALGDMLGVTLDV